MSRLALGLIAGIVYGALSAASMIPLEFADKRAALTGAFLNRFAIGVLIGAVIGSPQTVSLGVPNWLIGLFVGLLMSVPDAIITRAYLPVIGLGAVGGAIIGWVVGKWGTP
jgi:hypothetical protein